MDRRAAALAPQGPGSEHCTESPTPRPLFEAKCTEEIHQSRRAGGSVCPKGSAFWLSKREARSCRLSGASCILGPIVSAFQGLPCTPEDNRVRWTLSFPSYRCDGGTPRKGDVVPCSFHSITPLWVRSHSHMHMHPRSCQFSGFKHFSFWHGTPNGVLQCEEPRAGVGQPRFYCL